MKFTRKLSLPSLACALICTVAPLRAGIVINMVESGSDVVATLSGSIDSMAGAVYYAPGTAGLFSGFRASGPTMNFAFANQPGFPLVDVDYYSISNFPTSFGTSEDLKVATTSTASANMLFRNLGVEALYIDQAYVFGTPVTGTMTWANQTFASLGVTEGSYVWSWTGDSVTLNIGAGPEPIPEPGTWAAAALLVGGAAFARWRKRANLTF